MPAKSIQHRRRCLRSEKLSLLETSPAASQSEIESGPGIDHPLGPDAATVSRDNSLGDRQADAGAAGKLPPPVQTLEWPEEFVDVSSVETGAVIAHVKGVFLPHALLPKY